MTRPAWKGFVASVAVVTLVAVAAAVSIGVAYPEPVSSGALGPDWECTRMALVFTSCAPRVVRVGAVATDAKAFQCRRGLAWRFASASR